MPLTGSDKALMYALGGVARGGATRGGYTDSRVYIAIAGVHYGTARAVDAQKALYEDGAGLSITEALNQAPNTASLMVEGFTPTVGQECIITLGSKNNRERRFAGTIREIGQDSTTHTARYALSLIDWHWRLDEQLVSGYFTGSATAIAQTLMATYAPSGYTALHVEAGLPTVEGGITFTLQKLSTCLDRLAKRIGGYWFIDYHKDLNFFVTGSEAIQGPNPSDLVAGNTLLQGKISIARNIGQIVTRVLFEGRGVTAITSIPAGSTTLPLLTVADFASGGGSFKSGPQICTYTGILEGGNGTLVGPGVSPSSPPTLALRAGAGVETGAHNYAVTFTTGSGESLPSPIATITIGPRSAPSSAPTAGTPASGSGPDSGAHYYGVTFTDALGETTVSPLSNTITTSTLSAPSAAPTVEADTYTGGVTAGAHDWAYTWVTADGETTPSPVASLTVVAGTSLVYVNGIAIGPAGVTERRLYRTEAGGAQLKLLTTIHDNTSTGFNDTTPDASLATNVPAANTAYVQRVTLSGIPIGGTGITGRKIYRTAAGGSQLKLAGTLSNNSATSWVDSVTDAGLGANVPTSNTSGGNQADITNIPIGGTGVTGRKVYRTVAGGSQLKLRGTIGNNTDTSLIDDIADASLGANVPTSDTSGLSQPDGQVAAGATSILVAGAAAFSTGGGWAIIGNGEQAVKYTGITTQTLTGIPASGVGAITATIAYNSTITAAPCLTGIPASGTGAIAVGITKGDSVNVLVQVDDEDAQATLAALIGGDGVREEHVPDRRLSITESTTRAEAILALKSGIEVTAEWTTRDPNTRAGRLVTVDLGSPTNTTAELRIQQVTTSRCHPGLMPTTRATASNLRYSFEDLINGETEA